VTDGREEQLRVDLLLHRLCLTRSRSEAKAACDAGAVWINGKPARASHEAGAGDAIRVRFPATTLDIRVDVLPPKSTSKKAAREMYSVVGEERTR
jgi:ribosomal 50S subunit-recycling heat shock protein